MELLLNPRTVSAPEALTIGLASEVVPVAQFEARLAELAATLAAGPTLAYAAIRHSVAFSASHSVAESLEFEGEQMRRTGATEDHRLAVQSFLGKQSPTFTGR
jgi:2-(1,2-epoxy-1,2-dihydrophenyl)acetyl-CoA isomerase